jgi:hypothetical protein
VDSFQHLEVAVHVDQQWSSYQWFGRCRLLVLAGTVTHGNVEAALRSNCKHGAVPAPRLAAAKEH